MKKFLIAVLFILLSAGIAIAEQSIGNTTDTLVTTGRGYLSGIIVHADGTNAVTVAVYDNTTNTGSKLFSTLTVTTSATNRTTTLSFDPEECLYFTGMYFDITTSGTVTFDVYFKVK